MNTEKELLLALLIEKYSNKAATQINANLAQAKAIKTSRRRRHSQLNHKWSASEAINLMSLFDMGYSYAEITRQMNLIYPGVKFRTNSVKQKIRKENIKRQVQQ